MRAATAAIVFLALPMAASSQIPRVLQGDGFSLTQTASYGWERPKRVPGMGPLDEKAGGAMFGRVSDIAVGSGGILYVLDPEFKKVVSFDSTGTFRRVITAGSGEGPGEFVRPRSLTMLSGSQFAVADQSKGRLTVFDTTGAVLKTSRVPYARVGQVIYAGSQYYVRRYEFGGRPLVVVLSAQGVPIDSFFPTRGRIAEFSEFGENGVLSLQNSGEILFAHPAAGLWSSSGDWKSGRFVGKDLYPKVKGSIIGTQTRFVPVAVRGIVKFTDGTVVILSSYTTLIGSEFDSKNYLSVFDSKGAHRANIEFPSDAVRMWPGFNGMDALIAFSDPFPQVVKYQLEQASRGAR